MPVLSVYLKFHKVLINILAKPAPRSRCQPLTILWKLPHISLSSEFHTLGSHSLDFHYYRLIFPDLLIFVYPI